MPTTRRLRLASALIHATLACLLGCGSHAEPRRDGAGALVDGSSDRNIPAPDRAADAPGAGLDLADEVAPMADAAQSHDAPPARDGVADTDSIDGPALADATWPADRAPDRPAAADAAADQRPPDLPRADATGRTTLAISPAGHNFGIVRIGTASREVLFAVTNTGAAPSSALTVRIEGGDPTAFATPLRAGGCQGRSLAPAGTCTVTVVFAPATMGARNSTLAVAAGGDRVTAPLAGAAY
jgi:hypothetical protein